MLVYCSSLIFNAIAKDTETIVSTQVDQLTYLLVSMFMLARYFKFNWENTILQMITRASSFFLSAGRKKRIFETWTATVLQDKTILLTFPWNCLKRLSRHLLFLDQSQLAVSCWLTLNMYLRLFKV